MILNFAELDETYKVTRVIIIHENDTLDENGISQEEIGIQFCQNLFGGNWVQTFEDGSQRKKFASIGDTYDPDKKVFIPSQKYPSWSFDEDKWGWVAPVSKPENDDKIYQWDENTISWIEAQ